jgi:hypothetical protein
MELYLEKGNKKYYVKDSFRKRKGICKQCQKELIGQTKVLLCDTGYDVISEIEPHCVGMFHTECLDIYEL